MNEQTYFLTQDQDSHWYTVPVEQRAEFQRLDEGGEETEVEFISKFSRYVVGGDPSRIEFIIVKH